MPDVRAKALTYLREGRVSVQTAFTYTDRPYEVVAHVQGYGRLHIVSLDRRHGWYCTCPLTTGCAHIAAVQLVTGHPSAARKNVAAPSHARPGTAETAPTQ